MCNAALVLGGLTTVQIFEQSRQAQATNDFNVAQAGKVRVAAQRAAQIRFKAIIAQRKEQRANTAREVEAITRQAVKASGATRLQGAGGSVASVLANITAQEIAGKRVLSSREEFQDLQATLEFGATEEQAKGRALAAQRARVKGPTLLGAALRIGASTATGFFQDQAAKTNDLISSRLRGARPRFGSALGVNPNAGLNLSSGFFNNAF